MPLRRPQNLELESNAAVSLYPAVPVMRGGTYGAHSPMSAGRPRSPMLGPSPAHRAATPLGHAYSPAPKSGSMGSIGGVSVGSPHVHWADFAFVREVSNIFDRQVQLGLPPHTPEAVENPFRRRTQRQFYMDGETPPAMSSSAGTLFTMAPVPQDHSQAAQMHHNQNAMFAGMFAGMGTPVMERSVSPSHQQQQQHQQSPHFGVTYASGGASRAMSSAATARPHPQSAAQPARTRPSTPGVPPGRSGGPTIVQAAAGQHQQHPQYQQQYQQQQQQQQQQAQQVQLGGAYTASRRTAPRNSISAPSGQAYAYTQQTSAPHSSAGHAYGRSNSSWM